jgi:hypothetical protein
VPIERAVASDAGLRHVRDEDFVSYFKDKPSVSALPIGLQYASRFKSERGSFESSGMRLGVLFVDPSPGGGEDRAEILLMHTKCFSLHGGGVWEGCAWDGMFIVDRVEDRTAFWTAVPKPEPNPAAVIAAEADANDSNECCICLDEVEGTKCNTCGRCKTLFHEDCPNEWWRSSTDSSNSSTSCPLCKYDFRVEQLKRWFESAGFLASIPSSSYADREGEARGCKEDESILEFVAKTGCELVINEHNCDMVAMNKTPVLTVPPLTPLFHEWTLSA